MAYDVFISHSSKDKPIADGVCATLEQNGLRCWIAPRDIVPGEEWSTAIVRALEQVKVFVLVLSHAANESHQISREVERAVHNSLPIIPYRIENIRPTDALEYFISTPHWLDAFSPPVEQHAQALAAAIKRLLGDAHEAPAVTPTSLPPPPAAPPTPAASAPTGAGRPSTPVLLGGAAAAVVALVALGYFAFGPKPASAAQTFVGDWNVAKVDWAPGVSGAYAPITLGELFAAVMNANRTTGSFTLSPSGAFQTIVELDDTGRVMPAGPYLAFTSTDGATAVVRPTRLASGAALGGQLGEAGLVLQGNRRLAEPWVGQPDPLAAGGPLGGLAGTWRSAGWPVTPDGQAPSATLIITPTGAYTLKLQQKIGGTFTSGGGAWNANVAGAGGAVGQTGGSYGFSGPDQVTVTSAQGSTTWARKPRPGGAG